MVWGILLDGVRSLPEECLEGITGTGLDLFSLSAELEEVDPVLASGCGALFSDLVGEGSPAYRFRSTYETLAHMLEHAEKTYGPFEVRFDDPEVPPEGSGPAEGDD